MGVIFADSFDYYPTASLVSVYNGSTPQNAAISTSSARSGTQGLNLSTNSSSQLGAVIWVSSSNHTQLIVGFAMRINSLPAGTSIGTILTFLNSSGTNGSYISLSASGQLRIYSYNGGFTGLHDDWTGTALTTGTWYYVEVSYKATASSAAGDITIRVDYGSGPTVVNEILAGFQTYQSVANAQRVEFGAGNGGTWSASANIMDIDDLYILDPTSGVNTTFLGNCVVDCINPSGAGSSSQWTANGTTPNYACVDEAVYGNDAYYVNTTGVGNRDSYTLPGISSSPTSIYAVHLIAWGEDDTGGTSHTGDISLRIAGTYYDSATFTFNNSIYRPYQAVWEDNPNTSVPFVKSDIAGMEAGIKLVS